MQTVEFEVMMLTEQTKVINVGMLIEESEVGILLTEQVELIML